MPSNDMIERVARAIYAELPIGHAEARACARAAIEAMREPTPEMERVGAEELMSLGGWQAMIDAALHPMPEE